MSDTNNDEAANGRFAGRTPKGKFKKGHCGNPKGRPKRARSTRAIFQAMLASKVPMTIDGKVRLLTVTEAMAARVKREALAGPLRGLERGVAVAQLYSLDDAIDKVVEPDLSILTDEELEQYGRIAAKLLGERWDSDDPSEDGRSPAHGEGS